MNKYAEYILNNVEGTGYGKCKQIATNMANHFPELEVRYGIFHSLLWGEREHYWCLNKSTNTIIDPTGNQFPDGYTECSNTNAAYEDLTDLPEDQLTQRLPSGKCPNCGDYIYGDNDYGGVCSQRCATEYTAYLKGAI